MKFIILFISHGILFIGTCNCQSYSLEECFSIAVKNNILLKKNRNTLQSNYLDKKNASFNLLPSLGLSAEHVFSAGKNIDPVTNNFIKEQFSGGEADMTLRLNIFSGFTAVNTIKASIYKLKAGSYNCDKTALEIFSAVATAYAKAMYAREQIATIQKNNASTKNELDIIQEKINVGKLSKSDYYAVNARFKSEQADLVEAQNEFLNAIAELKYQTGLNTNSPAGIDNIDKTEIENILNKNFIPEEMLPGILNRHPALLETKFYEKVAQINLAIAKGNLLPTISVTGNLFSNYNLNERNLNGSHVSFNRQVNNNFGKTVGIILQLPLFTKFENRYLIEREKINVANAKLATIATETELIKNIQTLINDFTAAKQRYQLQSASLEQGELSYNSVEERHKLGFISSLELITAKDQLRMVQDRATHVKYDLYFKYALINLLLHMPVLE